MECNLTHVEIIDSVITRLNFVLLRLATVNGSVNTDIITSLVTEMLLTEYGLSEKDIEVVMTTINDLNVFCDSVISIFDENNETSKESDNEEVGDITLNDKNIRIC